MYLQSTLHLCNAIIQCSVSQLLFFFFFLKPRRIPLSISIPANKNDISSINIDVIIWSQYTHKCSSSNTKRFVFCRMNGNGWHEPLLPSSGKVFIVLSIAGRDRRLTIRYFVARIEITFGRIGWNLIYFQGAIISTHCTAEFVHRSMPETENDRQNN